MDRQQKRSDASVEQILAELHRSGKVSGESKSQNVDDILAGVKAGVSQGTKPSSYRQKSAPVVREAKQGAEAQPHSAVQQENVQQPFFYDTEEPPQQSGPRVGKAAALERVQADKYVGDTELSKWFSGNEDQHLSPREQKRLQRELRKQEKNKGLPAEEESWEQGEAQEEPWQAEAVPQQDTQTQEGTRRLPKLGDFDDEQEALPRVGKAAALDRVQKDKYVGDAELSEWFADNEDRSLSPRELKRLEKERKKQEKIAIKEEKRLGRKRGAANAEEEQDHPYYEETKGAFHEQQMEAFEGVAPQGQLVQPEDNGKALREAFAEIQNTRPDLPERAQTNNGQEAQGMSLLDFAQQNQTPTMAMPTTPQPTVKPTAGVSFGGVSAAVAPPPLPSVGISIKTNAAQETQVFEAEKLIENKKLHDSSETQVFLSPESMKKELDQGAAFLAAASVTGTFPKPLAETKQGPVNTKRFDLSEQENERIPTAAYTQEFENNGAVPEQKNLFVDEMVDDRFRQFFGETVIVEQEEEQRANPLQRRKNKKHRTTLLTGEFSQFAPVPGQEEEEDFEDDYNNPQDAQIVEQDLFVLGKKLRNRGIGSAIGTVLLFWLALGFSGVLALPELLNPMLSPLFFVLLYFGLFAAVLAINFTTVASGIIGLFGEATADSAVAVASVAALLQAVVLAVMVITANQPEISLFAPVAALLLCGNAFGKKMRCDAILEGFRLASSGQEQSAAYVLEGGGDVAYHVTRGLEEETPTILVSRPTALMKGFLRQSFSRRWSDTMAKKMAWVCLGTSLMCFVLGFIFGGDLVMALSGFAAAACVVAPLSSTLLSAVPSILLQQAGRKLGVVVPGWSAIEELGGVNVVMAGAKDIFPQSSVTLKGIKTFEQERIDLAILYAASILTENCDTMQDVFMGVIQGKKEMLFKVENLLCEVGRGFVGFVDNNRVVVGTREMLQVHDIDPPPIEMEMKLCSGTSVPLYLAVSGKLFAMFLIEYTPEPGVRGTLYGLLHSGVSMLVQSKDPCISSDLIEQVYQLPKGVVKVLDKKEEHLMEPMCSYLPESEGVMSHLGTFTSFIGGMRAAATCMESERMSSFVQMAGMVLACVLALLLAFSGALPLLSVGVALLYQMGWSLLVGILPLARRN